MAMPMGGDQGGEGSRLEAEITEDGHHQRDIERDVTKNTR